MTYNCVYDYYYDYDCYYVYDYNYDLWVTLTMNMID